MSGQENSRLPPTNTGGQRTSQQVPNYLNAINAVRNIVGGDNDNINSIRLPTLNRNITTPITSININGVELPADVLSLFTRITDDRRNRAQSSDTTIEDVIRRRNELRNGINGVIDNFIGLSISIDNLQIPIQGTSSVDSNRSTLVGGEGENKNVNQVNEVQD